ncbi:MAG: N-acetylmuramoyl-L-alanine amidase [bacterium]|nr:N-acetylmuramoyl-L-alanine amidase [bacterium]
MRSTSLGLGLLTMLPLAGCAHSRTGVLPELPPAVFATPTTSAEPTPKRRPAIERPDTGTARPTIGVAGINPPGGMSNRWKCIVVHHSGGSHGGARAFHEYHTKVRRWDELGYHFVIGNGTNTPDGLIETGSRWTKQKHGAHCKTADNFYNDHGIGICLVGNFEDTRPTRAQLASLERLVEFLMTACSIPAGRIYTHGGLTGRTACPGRHFSLPRLKQGLQQANAGQWRR